MNRVMRILLSKNHPLFYQLRNKTIQHVKTSEYCGNNTKELNIDFTQLDPDKFGDLDEKFGNSAKLLKSELLSNDPDGYDSLEIKRGIKISLPAYERILAELFRKKPRNVAEMLKTYNDMAYDNRYKPSIYIYTMMITACAQVGYTKKALELFREMKQYDYKPTRAMVTSLFNACANCTLSKEYGLENLLKLREELDSSGYQYNLVNYNALVKAFAIFGDSENLELTLQEMKKKNIGTDLNTFNMFLVGSISDQKNGLYTAILAMKMILKSNLKLNADIFNLFLRCVRDCEIEDEQKLLEIFNKVQINKIKRKSNEEKHSLMERKQILEETLPNLLNEVTSNQNEILAIDFKSLSSPINRFVLFGGIKGFFKMMDLYQIKPDLKTLTIIIDLLPQDNCLEEIMALIDHYQLKPDICFYNVLIKKFAKTKNYQSCQILIQKLQENNIRPDIMTFSALAFSCHGVNDTKKLLEEMNLCHIIPNNQIMGIFINKACGQLNIRYLDFILDYFEQNSNLKLSKMDIERVDLALHKIKQEIINCDRNNIECKNIDVEKFNKILARFKELLKNVNIVINSNVWSQYEQNDYKSPKLQFHSTIKYMKKKIDIKMNRDNKQSKINYQNETDD